MRRFFNVWAFFFALFLFLPSSRAWAQTTTFEDSFVGTASTYVDARYTTRLSDNAATTHKWKAFSGGVYRIHSSGTGAVAYYNPLPNSPLLAITARQNAPDGIVEATLSTINNSALRIGLNVDPATGKGYYFQMGLRGFPGVVAELYKDENLLHLQTFGTAQKGNTGTGDTSLDGAVGHQLSLKLECQTLTGANAGRHRLIASYKIDSGSYQTAFDDMVTISDQQAMPTYGGVPALQVANFGSAGNVTRFIATYTQSTNGPPAGVSSSFLVVGDSNNQFTASALGGKTIANAVATSLLSDGYTQVHAFNEALSGSTSGDWASGTGNTPYMLAHAAAVASFQGIKVGYIALGTNDGKDSVATSAAAYKTNIAAIIASLQAAGVTKIVLFDPAYVSASAGDFSGANARLQTYASKNGELVASGSVAQVSGLYSYFATNNGSTYLPDGIHYANGTAGAPAARDIYYNGIKASVLAAYSVVSSITVSPATVTLTAGQTSQTFTAVAKDADGVVLPSQPTFIWTTASPAISSGGVLTLPTSYTVTATYATVSGTATAALPTGSGGGNGATLSQIQAELDARGLTSAKVASLPTAAQAANAVLAAVVDGAITIKQALGIQAAVNGNRYTVGTLNTTAHTQVTTYYRVDGTTPISTMTVTYGPDNRTPISRTVVFSPLP